MNVVPGALDYMQPVDDSYGRQVSLVMELLQGKWTVHILCAMRGGSVRLSELRRALPSASKKGLTTSLRSLEAAKVIVRRDLSASVLHVEYELSEAIAFGARVELIDRVDRFMHAIHRLARTQAVGLIFAGTVGNAVIAARLPMLQLGHFTLGRGDHQ
ncbi:MAG TPA: helix-turn-helix domain-containing protein, partial [Terriglobales bacterium]|nr:helix-turn-helix domain-containing protein [Terriglobales bacterium]